MGRSWSGNQALGNNEKTTLLLSSVITLSTTPALLATLMAAGTNTPSATYFDANGDGVREKVSGPSAGQTWLHPMTSRVLIRAVNGASGNFCVGADDVTAFTAARTTFPSLPSSAEVWSMTFGVLANLYLAGTGTYEFLQFG
jgi:hypothetical protein